MTNILWPGDHLAGEICSDAALLDAMMQVEAAWSTALVEAGVAPAEALVDIAELRDLVTADDLELVAVDAEGGGNPVIPVVTMLRSRLGEGPTARWLHRGLTSQDVVDSALMVCVAASFAAIGAEFDLQAKALGRLADRRRHTPMVARTLTQHAVPMTFGLKAASWLRGILDARDHVATLSFPVQLGGAAGTAAALVELGGGDPGDAWRVVPRTSTVVARALGLQPSAPWHSVRTAVVRAGDAAVGCTDAWGHIANDVLTLSRPEIGELGEGVGGGSSTMPHKSNPVLSALIRRTAISSPPLAATLHLAAADAVDERTAGGWHAEWDTTRTLARRTLVAARQSTRLLHELRVNVDRMAANLAAAGDAVSTEQSTMAGLVGRVPSGGYQGAADYFLETQLDRLRATE